MSNNLVKESFKTAIVTGGSSGIGRGIAQKFIDNGYFVFTISRSETVSLGLNHTHICADLSQWEECARSSELIGELSGGVDVLINNVGLSEWRSIQNIDQNFFNEMVSLNIGSYVAVTQKIFPYLREGSSIVNISSMAGKRGTKNNSIYCATKFAINGLTQSWAKEFGSVGIRVNAICPVLIRSEGLITALIKDDAPAHDVGLENFMAGFTASQAALDSLPEIEDVGNFCLFLASDKAKKITGQCINLDSGVFPQ